MKEYVGKPLKDLPEDISLDRVKVKIPDDVIFLPKERRLEEAYIVSLHANGTGMFVSIDRPVNSYQIFPVYPPSRESVLEWLIVDVAEEV